jgi:hypothetical protein
MTPVNNKSVLALLFAQMEKLDNKEITVDEAKGMAELAKQVNSSMKYELDRANVKMKIRQHNFEYKDNIELRDVESKNFE